MFVQDIFQVLDELKISYQKYDHPAVFTVEEAGKYYRGDAMHTKNLFLRNKNGKTHYLVIFPDSKRIDLKKLEVQLHETDLSFASPERLMKYLGLIPGSVSPFGLINDTNKEVNVVVDQSLLNAEKQAFHPNINTATLVISTGDFKKFLDWTGNKIIHLDL